MNTRRDDDDDDAVDRQIASVLNVDPSPDFVWRIRARIAIEASRNRWNHWVLAATGAVVLTAVVVLVAATTRPQPPVTQGVTKSPASVAQTTIEMPTKRQEALAPQKDNPSHRRNVSRLMEKQREPELVLSPGEVQALATFVDTLRAGKTDVRQPEDSTEAMNQTIAPIDDISIPLITIEPLSQSQ